MGVDVELTRGAFLTPVLVRAVRAVGVQSGLDLDRLANASLAVEAIAECWTRGDTGEPLRVAIDACDGALEVAFLFAAPSEAGRARAECFPADGGTVLERLAATVAEVVQEDGSRLVLSFH